MMSEEDQVEHLLAEEDDDPVRVNLFLAVFLPLLAIFSKLIGTIALRLSKLFFKADDKERQLAKTAVDLRNEMKSLSMVDEFAKYAKIQRRLNQINLDLEATVGCRQSLQSQVKRILTICGHVLATLVTAVTLYKYRSVPVFIVPESWFFPLTPALSYPTGIPGSISVVAWIFIVRNLTPIILRTKS
ncbi:unnamed protein product [Allacma fusca]|uniref:Tail-anchored protein insertion receptor WRB n=1 Tax=Allacma fusca TaxID=39272 RepID=A0A8J2PKB3_9HEXA|nr:unnamed protein product [Allacma fusca]